jgi:mRNA-degrading endonuclease RelE of RelBE toxin-antitoxin system
MKAVEITGTIDEKGQLLLDRPLVAETPGRVRIILLLPEPTDEAVEDPDDTPVEEIKASLKRALQQAKAGQTRPISELWERVDAETGQLLLDRPLTLDIPGLSRIILKVRVKNSNIQKGKSAGYRMIYRVESPSIVLLLTIYSKSDRADISPNEIRNIIADFDESE